MNNRVNFTPLHYLLVLLRAYAVRQVVASPGIQNAFFNLLCQQSNDFSCHSVIDERSAAYVAAGLAEESGEPVVITCTEATASRNYMSALTECYYRHIPVIAVTFYNPIATSMTLSPQHIERSVMPKDITYLSVNLPQISDEVSRLQCVEYLNAALLTAKFKHQPVHINVPSCCYWPAVNAQALPTDYSVTNWIDVHNFNRVSWGSLQGRKVAVFIGTHAKFSADLHNAVSHFAQAHGIPVFCEHNSNYKGSNKISSTFFSAMIPLRAEMLPDVIIDMGGISADYFADVIFRKASVLRLAPDGEFKCRNHHIPQVLFAMDEGIFFNTLNAMKSFVCDRSYMELIRSAASGYKVPELPLSTALVCQTLSTLLAKPCSLHFAILNSYRMANCFDFDEQVQISCNTGGFGIDGAVSSLFGHSIFDKERLCIGVVGDLAFFYDMNVLGNRELGKNFRLIVVNNSGGEEFRLNKGLTQSVTDKVEPLVAAAGHNGGGVKGWAESAGCIYLHAPDKKSFIDQSVKFCHGHYNRPVVFEVITKDDDERRAYDLLFSRKA